MSEYDLMHQALHTSELLQSLPAYSDTLCNGLCRLHVAALPLVSAPPHMLPLCLFVCLFILVPWHHMLLALFVYFPFQIVSIVDRQQCRQDISSVSNLPLGTSFGPQNALLSLQVKNPTIGMLFLIRIT